MSELASIDKYVLRETFELAKGRAETAEALTASSLELLREVMEEYHKGIQSPLEFSEWLRAMDRVYGWELAEKLDDK